jgi:hypothetical protein
MPRFLDDKNDKKKGKRKRGLLEVSMREAQRRAEAGEEFTEADWAKIKGWNEEMRVLVKEIKEEFRKRIEHFAPWFTWDEYSFARLSAELTKQFPNEPMSSWLDLTQTQLVGVIDACAPPPKKPKKREDKPVTKWVREHRSEYRSNKDTVRAYIKLHGGTIRQLYDTDLKNDLKNNPLSLPKKSN